MIVRRQRPNVVAYVTLHEMFYIFQISNYVEYESWEHDDALHLREDQRRWTEHKPWWMEGNAATSPTFTTVATGDFEHLYNEMGGLWTPTDLRASSTDT